MNKINLPKFRIQQIALNAPENSRAKLLLEALGLTDWTTDEVVSGGYAFGSPCENEAELLFNYQCGNGKDEEANKPLELEIIKYTQGKNWLSHRPVNVSHLGMHVTNEELIQYRAFFANNAIRVAQEVITKSHTNEAIKDERRYNYVIFDTYDILGVDLKFIVRLDTDYKPYKF